MFRLRCASSPFTITQDKSIFNITECKTNLRIQMQFKYKCFLISARSLTNYKWMQCLKWKGEKSTMFIVYKPLNACDFISKPKYSIALNINILNKLIYHIHCLKSLSTLLLLFSDRKEVELNLRIIVSHEQCTDTSISSTLWPFAY